MDELAADRRHKPPSAGRTVSPRRKRPRARYRRHAGDDAAQWLTALSLGCVSC